MILSNFDIAEALDDGRVDLDPCPTVEQIQPASLDLRMGNEVIDVAEGRYVQPAGDTFRIHPWRFYRAATMESVTISTDLTAQIANRSSFAREGLIPHLIAGWVDPGWSGKLTLEMINVSSSPVDVDVGERVVQLVFHETKSESSGYDGQYQGATGPEDSGRIR